MMTVLRKDLPAKLQNGCPFFDITLDKTVGKDHSS